MAKISPVSIKYMIKAKFEAEGAVERPDVIGALFGQTEGLLGSELEMRELQKEGKIGRIEVRLESENGKTIGTIEIPSALDKAETTLIAAAIETIERIGPTDAKIEIGNIEDIRGSKREYIVERAKKLLAGINETTPGTRAITENLKVKSKLAKLQEYGKDELPAGDISGNEIIIVEGRADVVNLLKNDIINAVGMDGTQLPETIKELCNKKEATLFVDGDRGGKLIVKNVTSNAKISYVAYAPDGKEVEELTKKEILISLRKKVPVRELTVRAKPRERKGYERKERAEKEGKVSQDEQGKKIKVDKKKLQKVMEDIEGTKTALFLDKNLKTIKKSSSNAVVSTLNKMQRKVDIIVMDGTATQYVIKAAERANINTIAAKNFSYSKETDVNLISL